MICPSDTPEGEGCGLIKNLALMVHVSLEESAQDLTMYCYALGVEDIVTQPYLYVSHSCVHTVWINGICIGTYLYIYTAETRLWGVTYMFA